MRHAQRPVAFGVMWHPRPQNFVSLVRAWVLRKFIFGSMDAYVTPGPHYRCRLRVSNLRQRDSGGISLCGAATGVALLGSILRALPSALWSWRAEGATSTSSFPQRLLKRGRKPRFLTPAWRGMVTFRRSSESSVCKGRHNVGRDNTLGTRSRCRDIAGVPALVCVSPIGELRRALRQRTHA